MDLKKKIRNVPDFPKKGIVFRDITTLLSDSDAFKYSVDKMTEQYKGKKIDLMIGAEARGLFLVLSLHTIWGQGSYRLENPENFPIRPVRLLMILNMERIYYRCMWML